MLSLAAIAFALVFAVTMVGNVMAKTMTITGKVEQGKIMAEDGNEYAVADNAKGKELMKDHMGHKVEVKGNVTEKDGKQTIEISSIKHLSDK